MSRAVRMQHTPGRGASHSRRGGLRWRRPRTAKQPWTRTFRRSRHAIASTLGRVEASARVIEAAECFAPSRPREATRQLLLVALWLSEAATHLERAARGLHDTTVVWSTVAGAPAEMPQRIAGATALWLDASRRLLDASDRLGATFAQLYGGVTGSVIRLETAPAATQDRLKPVPTAGTWQQHSVGTGFSLSSSRPHTPLAAALAGARKISRGRAPPLASICAL